MSSNDDTDQLLKSLSEIASKTISESTAMPAKAYHSEDFFLIEKQKLFSRDWQCAGRADNLCIPGDYLTWKLADQPIFVIKGNDHQLRAFSNICLHRMMPLLSGNGNIRSIVCPYHAWTYSTDGKLRTCMQMKQSKILDHDNMQLPEIRLEVWKGWIYVTLDNTIPPISDLLCELASVVQPYGMENYVSVVQDDFIWNTNWKILTENFMEGYHLPVVHKKTVGNWFATNKTCFPSNRSVSFTFQTFSKNPDAIYGGAHPMNKRLIGEQRQTSIMPTVFPAHMYVLAPDHLWYLALNPLGVGQLGIRFGIALAPEVNNNIQDRKKFISELNTFFDKVNAEDKKIVESIFESTKAPLAKPGPLSWLEREIHDLIFYLSKRLEYKNEGAKN